MAQTVLEFAKDAMEAQLFRELGVQSERIRVKAAVEGTRHAVLADVKKRKLTKKGLVDLLVAMTAEYLNLKDEVKRVAELERINETCDEQNQRLHHELNRIATQRDQWRTAYVTLVRATEVAK